MIFDDHRQVRKNRKQTANTMKHTQYCICFALFWFSLDIIIVIYSMWVAYSLHRSNSMSTMLINYYGPLRTPSTVYTNTFSFRAISLCLGVISVRIFVCYRRIHHIQQYKSEYKQFFFWLLTSNLTAMKINHQQIMSVFGFLQCHSHSNGRLCICDEVCTVLIRAVINAFASKLFVVVVVVVVVKWCKQKHRFYRLAHIGLLVYVFIVLNDVFIYIFCHVLIWFYFSLFLFPTQRQSVCMAIV